MLNEINVHKPARKINTQCPACAANDPGFIDYDAPDCPVACDACGHQATLVEWEEMHALTDAVEKHAMKIRINDAHDLTAYHLLTVVQLASAERETGHYTFSHVSDAVKLVVFSEGPLDNDETVCIVEMHNGRILFIADMAVAHPELLDRFEALAGWEVCEVDGLIGQAARRWVYA